MRSPQLSLVLSSLLCAAFVVQGCSCADEPLGGEGEGEGSLPIEIGRTCSGAGDCASGFCVDGVCCDSACDEACVACAATLTDEASGTCAPITAGTDPDDECDASGPCSLDTCNGGGSCFAGSDVTCRDAAGVCDVAEVCSGDSGDCPADAYAPDTTQCDGAVTCTGDSVDCPEPCTSDNECAVDFFCATTGACVHGKLAFLTSGTTTGNIGGLSGGDSYCTMHSTSAGRRGTFKAWLSDDATGAAAARLTHATIPYRLANGTQIADDFADLSDGTLDAQFNVDEEGGSAAFSSPWTGTTGTGQVAADNCSNWSNGSSGLGTIGNSEATTSTWTDTTGASCSIPHRVFCLQQ